MELKTKTTFRIFSPIKLVNYLYVVKVTPPWRRLSQTFLSLVQHDLSPARCDMALTQNELP
jgi:hypothetical protein